jgi:hypothetical protein
MTDRDAKAFPIGDSRGALDPGMDLRDYFAIEILSGIAGQLPLHGRLENTTKRRLCEDAYSLADMMMKVRKV